MTIRPGTAPAAGRGSTVGGMSTRTTAPSRRDRIVLAAAVLLPLLVVLVVVPFRTHVPGSSAALLAVVAVVAVAQEGRRPAGWLAAVSAAVWFDLFLTRPYGSLSIHSTEDVVTAALLVVVGVAVTELAVRGRRHRATADLDEGYLRTLSRVGELAGSHGAHATAAAVRDALVEILGAREVRFERGQVGGMPRLDASGQIAVDDGAWPVGQVGLPPMPFEIVAERGGVARGRFVVQAGPDARPDRTARRVAKVLVDQVATALAHEGGRASRV